MCLRPIKVRHPEFGDTYYVPCGSCPQCREAKRNSWQFRVYEEFKASPFSRFVTLTYDDDNLPTEHYVDMISGEVSEKAYQVFDNSHIREFLKALRYRLSIHSDGLQLRYYLIGERGERSGRVHYHALMFVSHDDPTYFSQIQNVYAFEQIFDKMLVSSWPYGFVSSDSVTDGSIGYVCGYMVKKPKYELDPMFVKSHELYFGDDRKYFFRTRVSLGLGAIWLDTPDAKRLLKYSHAPNKQKVVLKGENFIKTIPIPRYLKKKLYGDKTFNKSDSEMLKAQSMQRALERQKQNYADYCRGSESPMDFTSWIVQQNRAKERYIEEILPKRKQNKLLLNDGL